MWLTDWLFRKAVPSPDGAIVPATPPIPKGIRDGIKAALGVWLLKRGLPPELADQINEYVVGALWGLVSAAGGWLRTAAATYINSTGTWGKILSVALRLIPV